MQANEIIYPQKQLPMSLIGLIGIILFSMVMFLITTFTTYIVVACVFLLAVLLLLQVINKWHLEIFDDKVIIKGPVTLRQYFWKDISATFITSNLSPTLGAIYWYFNSSSEKMSGFEVNYFTRKQLKRIAEIISDKCPHATVDIKISNMLMDKFPWYIF